MSGLTRRERGQMIKIFLMASGGIALAMVPFALIGQLNLASVVLGVIGAVMMAAVPPLLLVLRYPAPLVYGMMTTGLAVIAGAVCGVFIINTVMTALH